MWDLSSLTRGMSCECMLLGSVSLQQEFGVTDIKASLGVSRLSGLDRELSDHVIALRS